MKRVYFYLLSGGFVFTSLEALDTSKEKSIGTGAISSTSFEEDTSPKMVKDFTIMTSHIVGFWDEDEED